MEPSGGPEQRSNRAFVTKESLTVEIRFKLEVVSTEAGKQVLKVTAESCIIISTPKVRGN